MAGPYVPDSGAGGMMPGEQQGFSGEVDSEEVVMATSSVQQHAQGEDGITVSETVIPIEHALMMIN